MADDKRPNLPRVGSYDLSAAVQHQRSAAKPIRLTPQSANGHLDVEFILPSRARIEALESMEHDHHHVQHHVEPSRPSRPYDLDLKANAPSQCFPSCSRARSRSRAAALIGNEAFAALQQYSKASPARQNQGFGALLNGAASNRSGDYRLQLTR